MDFYLLFYLIYIVSIVLLRLQLQNANVCLELGIKIASEDFLKQNPKGFEQALLSSGVANKLILYMFLSFTSLATIWYSHGVLYAGISLVVGFIIVSAIGVGLGSKVTGSIIIKIKNGLLLNKIKYKASGETDKEMAVDVVLALMEEKVFSIDKKENKTA
jgi:hypothetical protein